MSPSAPVPCFFATDLHGSPHRYDALQQAMERERPRAVFLGGDLGPNPWAAPPGFLEEFFVRRLGELRKRLGPAYPGVFAILGNDDARSDEPVLREAESRGNLVYVHGRSAPLDAYTVYGYAFVPPTPFTFKDWERYDVSRYVPPGSVSPEEGVHGDPGRARASRDRTIAKDLAALAGDVDLARAVFLFHTPPHETNLDRAGLDGRMVDHVPLDLHVGSIAVRRFLEDREPWLSLHGHVHESARIMGSWRDRIGRTECLGGAHDGPELALVRFDLNRPVHAVRELL